MRVETWEWIFYIIILSQSVWVEILSELWSIEIAIWFGRQEWSMTLCHGNIRNSSLLWHLLTPHTWANMNVHRLLHRIPSIWSQQCCLRNRSFVLASGASKGVFCKKIDQFSPKTYNYSHPHINTRLFSKSSWVLSEVCKQ